MPPRRGADDDVADDSTPAVEDAWQSRLCVREVRRGREVVRVLEPIAANVSTILVFDPRWTGVIGYDDFADTIVLLKAPPWRPWDVPKGGVRLGDWSEADTARLGMWLAAEYEIKVPDAHLLSGVLVAAYTRRFHPVRDWLESLVWDGRNRLSSWLVDVMGAKDTPYVRAVGQAWAVSAVARVLKPGCKVDTVLVLEGNPGIRKSSVLRALAGDEWFLEVGITDVANKDAQQVLRRKWVAEFPEIDGLARREQSAVKSYFSRQVDTYRPSYGKISRDFPRQIVFAATTNKSEWITDETGGTGRRMWPVWCSFGQPALAAAMREQFWAEAYVRAMSGEQWHMVDPELVDAEREEQDARMRADPWEEEVSAWLLRPSDLGNRRDGITTRDVLTGAFGIDPMKHTNVDAARVGAILRKIGWAPGRQERRNGARVRLYRPIVERNLEADDALTEEQETELRTLDALGPPAGPEALDEPELAREHG